MIRRLVNIFLKYKIWLSIIMIFNIMFGVFLWLMDSNSFSYIFPNVIIGSVLIYSLVGVIVYRIDKKKKESIIEFMENPGLMEEEAIINSFDGEEKQIVHLVGERLREKNQLIKKQESDLKEYEEYIETWAHEIKTPLALMTFVLDNRRDELSPQIYKRLEYARANMQDDIEKMLYYARVKAEHLDYIFTPISLCEICGDVIDEYKGLIEEQGITLMNEVEDLKIISDKKGLSFILRQILSNSIKYKDKEKSNSFIKLFTEVDRENDGIKLIIGDNGIGVKSYDLPFIFDKGFTGDAGQQRKQSTGMGLYLAEQVANNLKIEMRVSEKFKDGFEISLLFPIIN